MFFTLIAVIFAGLAGAGVMLILRKVLRGRLPGWAVPVGAGAAMLATTISSEYSWYERTVASLPTGVEVLQTRETRAFWRPWTYVVPMVEGFIALDTTKSVANEAAPGLYLVDTYIFGRWKPVTQVQLMIDCPGGRRADPARGDGGEPVWRDVGGDDPILRGVCAAQQDGQNGGDTDDQAAGQE
jgi:hypothetical protein